MSVGRYRLDLRVGAGAMGEVFLAHDDELERPVAIKLVHPHLLAMEYVEGQNLREWIKGRSPAWSEVLDAYLRAGRGLSAAHRAGLTHRDFKPDNVLRGVDGRILVADFGLASLGRAGDERRTTDPELGDEVALSRTGQVKGTPVYLIRLGELRVIRSGGP